MDKYPGIHYKYTSISVFLAHDWTAYKHVECYKLAPPMEQGYHTWSSIRQMCSFGFVELGFLTIESFPIVKQSKRRVDSPAHPKTFEKLFCFSLSTIESKFSYLLATELYLFLRSFELDYFLHSTCLP